MVKRSLKFMLYIVEFIALQPFLMVVLLFFSFKKASDLGGWIFRHIGPYLRVNRTVHRNLDLIFPHLEPNRKNQIVTAMWDNLGRTLFEYVKLPTISIMQHPHMFEIDGIENLEAIIHDHQPGLLFSAHLGNWELGTFLAHQKGLQLAQVTRFLNNPFLRAEINYFHRRIARTVIPKGQQGGKQILKFLRSGGHVSMLADQKMNDGISVPFCGYDAMTAPAWARMAIQYQCPLIPFYAVRCAGTKFKIVYEPPIQIPQNGDMQERVYAVTKMMNEKIEQWIKAYPEQWFWVHKRFPKELYKD